MASPAFVIAILLTPFSPGNLEVHWPESNVLLSGDRLDPDSKEPYYNAIVAIEPAAAPTRVPRFLAYTDRPWLACSLWPRC